MSLVLQLQEKAINPDCDVSELLRMSMVVARKLNISDIKSWIENELNGYFNKKLPQYRILSGELKAKNPFHGWIPVQLPNKEIAEGLSKVYFPNPVGEVTDLLTNKDQDSFLISLEPGIERSVMNTYRIQYPLKVLVSRGAIFSISDGVRNKILDWSLKLEEADIIGEGMSFDSKEKTAASTINFNIEQMYDSQIMQGSTNSSQSYSKNNVDLESIKQVITELNENIHSLSLVYEDRQQLKSEIDTILSQLSAPKPKTDFVSSCLNSIHNILVGASGNVLANEFLQKIAPLLFT